jgi:hypothetical protein
MLLLQNMNCSLLTAAVLQVATLRCCPGIRNNITVLPSLATSLARLRTTVVTRRSRIPASRKSAVVGQADLAWATRPRGSLSRRAAWRRRCIADARRARCFWQNGSSHRACRLLQASGMLLGMGKTVQFTETRVILDAGDIVVFYTDLTEAAN